MENIKTAWKNIWEQARKLCRTCSSKYFWKTFLKTKKGLACVIAVAVLVLAGGVWGGYSIWLDEQPKFQNVTVELGTETVTLRDFMTEYANAGKVGFVSDPSTIDLNQVGTTALILRHGKQEQTVTLTVQDTVAPTAQITPAYVTSIHDIPTATELVRGVEDEDQVRIYYEKAPVVPLDYSDVTVNVIVEDGSGNQTIRSCVISYRWMQESYTLELGETLTKDMLLLNPQRDQVLLDQAQLDAVNGSDVGEYTLTGTVGGTTQSCTVTVQDTKGPELVLKPVQRYPGREARLEDFISSVTDVSEVKEVRLVSQFDVNTKGKYEVTIEAEDIHGNVAAGTTTLWVTNDMAAPVISGKMNAMTVEKHSEPDFLAGISAKDRIDGACEVVCDTSKLDLHTAGTYYITYTAADSSGNVATVKRKVTVNHDAEDTAALVKEIAATLSDDVEQIRDYVRDQIYYTSSWGGDDPIWHGFTTKGGNCYVHALCLQALLEEKGYETQLIWVTNRSHYWVIVKLPEGWRHVDGTPLYYHGIYSLMTDEQRAETLRGRNWDRSAWPACVEEQEGE